MVARRFTWPVPSHRTSQPSMTSSHPPQPTGRRRRNPRPRIPLLPRPSRGPTPTHRNRPHTLRLRRTRPAQHCSSRESPANPARMHATPRARAIPATSPRTGTMKTNSTSLHQTRDGSVLRRIIRL
jgi:hypothetical protein